MSVTTAIEIDRLIDASRDAAEVGADEGEVDRARWPVARIGEGIEELVRRARLRSEATGDLGAAAPPVAGDVARWIEWAAARLGLEAESVDATVPDLPALLRGAAPAILRCAGGFYLLLGAKRGVAQLIAPDLSIHRRPLVALESMLCRALEAPLVPDVERLLQRVAIAPSRRDAVRAALLRERLAGERVGPVWMLRMPASAGFASQAMHARLPHRAVAMLAAFAVLYATEIGGWGLIGRAALEGRFDVGWFVAWLLLMATMIPLRLAGRWLESHFALGLGRLLKSRLLVGALRLPTATVRRQGVGHLIGQVIESQALETLALNGGIGAVVGLLEIAFALWLLAIGAGGALHVASLVAMLAATAFSGRRYLRRMRAWTTARLDLTHDQLERMVGHRTRLAQERPGRRAMHDDRTMQAYLATSKAMDAAAVPMLAGIPGAWMLLGLAGLAPAFVGGASASALAIGLGGILFAQRALGSIAGSMAGLARAWTAWEQTAELFAAGRRTAPLSPFVASASDATVTTTPVVDAQGLAFGYASGRRILDGADLRIGRGDRILLQGASGHGKSTLSSLLSGLHRPDAGLLLLDGLDRHTLGDAWHRRATTSPQFHENHVLSGPLAFNLLMAREWPAADRDLREAEALCEELGLGGLLARMPAGLMQRVGETGWQLSHGERSRIFLARALLQDADLTILDESFAALDPETSARCLKCVVRRAKSLVVIAHP